MATSQSSSPHQSPQEIPLPSLGFFAPREVERRQLAVRLADAIVTRSYAPLL
jgi:hypothetical protein